MAGELPYAWILLEEVDRARLLTWVRTGEWTSRGGEEREWGEGSEPPPMPAMLPTLQAVYTHWKRVLKWAEDSPDAAEVDRSPRRHVDLHLKPPARVVRPAAAQVVAAFDQLLSSQPVSLNATLDVHVPFEHWRRSEFVMRRLQELSASEAGTTLMSRGEMRSAFGLAAVMAQVQCHGWCAIVLRWIAVCAVVGGVGAGVALVLR